MRRYLEQFIKLSVAATFFVPLVLISSKFIFPFIVPKILIFRSLTLLMLGAYVVLLVSDYARYRPRVTLINIAVVAFFFSFFVSTFVGVDWYRSFWDNHERMLGLFTIFHYVVYYFIATSVIKEKNDWRWLLRLFLLAGGIAMFIGLLQKINPLLLLNDGSSRVSATLGNPIYYSGYGLFLFYIGLILFWKESVKEWKYFAIIGGALGFMGVFLGGTRGTLLGLIASVGILMVSYFFTLKEHKKMRQTIGAVIAAGIIVFSLLFAFRQTNFVQRIPAVGRLFSVSFASSTGATRIMAWKIAVAAWEEKPVFGWGPNNFYYAFNKYYQPESLERGWGETWFDAAHSAIFNALAVQGIVGLFLYVGLFAIAIVQLWFGYKKKVIDAHLLGIGAAFLVGHFIHNAVVFENPTSYLYFFFFLAFVNRQTFGVEEKEKKEKTVSPALTMAMLVVVLFLIYSTNINVARANMTSLRVLGAMQTGQLVAETYQKAVEMSSPHIDDIRSDFVRSLIMIIPQYNKASFTDKAKELYQLGYDESKKNLVLHPLDIRTHLQFAQLIQQGVMELKEPPQSLLEAETVLKDALVKSPKRQQIIYKLAMLELLIGKPDEAVILLQSAIDDDDRIGEGWWRLALVYAQTGDNDKAREIIKTAQDKGIVFDAQGNSVVSMILQADEKSK